MRIAIYGKELGLNFYDSIHLLFEELYKHFSNIEISIYKPYYDFIVERMHFYPKVTDFFTNKLNTPLDLIITVGGDGTFLEMVTMVKDSNVPMVGINSGRMGFLANISKDEISKALQSIAANQYSYENRALIQIETPNNIFADHNYALNEVTVIKKDTSSMITVHVYLNGDFLNTYWGDGLIVATPTGSTAYSLSVGGPIVMPDSSNFVISPIAPHNLTVRPIVVPDNHIITLRVEGRNPTFLASLDSRNAFFDSSIDLTIKRCSFSIRLLKLNGQNFFTTLRNKLMWGIDKRN